MSNWFNVVRGPQIYKKWTSNGVGNWGRCSENLHEDLFVIDNVHEDI